MQFLRVLIPFVVGPEGVGGRPLMAVKVHCPNPDCGKAVAVAAAGEEDGGVRLGQPAPGSGGRG